MTIISFLVSYITNGVRTILHMHLLVGCDFHVQFNLCCSC